MQVDGNTPEDVEAQIRFESFKLGKPRPTHSHARSHSRNASMSSFSFGTSKSQPTNLNELSTPSTKRNSHHRRRSSVSTRHESAEMMGVAVPDLPQSNSDDNIAFGDKDSVRRRALRALEGKQDVSYSKVEIPELEMSSNDMLGFEFPSKPSFPPGSGAGSSLSSLISSKRDSFKLLTANSSSKDQLHTLVEEDEDEEESSSSIPTQSTSPLPIEPSVPSIKPLTPRPRPASLNLRPLSLTPDNLNNHNSGLPTPVPTPSPIQPRSGLRSLSLASAPSMSATRRRPALNLQIASDGSIVKPDDPNSPDTRALPRRSSISYRSSSTSSTSSNPGLPTPEMTPTFALDRRFSLNSNDDDDAFPTSVSSSSSSSRSQSQTRPLSVSEQHFLYKSHNALLARIMDLEKALTTRQREDGSRPISMLSDASSSCVSNDEEMFRLVSDLKAERDELKRDVDGWRVRVADMDKQLVTFAKRVESERRDAWVARTKCGMTEMERARLEKEVEQLNAQLLLLKDETKTLTVQVDKLSSEKEGLEEEVKRLKALAEAEVDVLATPTTQFTPFTRKRDIGMSSLDSANSSVTDVDGDSDFSSTFGFRLKAVAEEPDDIMSDEDNGLAGYEDEEEDDIDVSNSPISDDDFSSDDGFPRSVVTMEEGTPVVNVIAPSRSCSPGLPTPVRTPPSHQSRASLSKTWTFPRGTPVSQPINNKENEEIDRFFGCLEEPDDVPVAVAEGESTEDIYTFERSKSLFASGFKYQDDVPPWLLGGADEVVDKSLDVVIEEDEEESGSDMTRVEEEEVFGDAGGIKITFTPPIEDTASVPSVPETPSPKASVKPVPLLADFEEDEEEEAVATPPLGFSRPTLTQIATPPSSIPRPAATPSGIPRSISREQSPSLSRSPPKFMTPPNKRGGSMPSFIPQPVSLCSPKPRASTTFIRQPPRKPLLPSKMSNGNKTSSNGSTSKLQSSTMMNNRINMLPRFSDDLSASPGSTSSRAGTSPQMMSVDLGNRDVPRCDESPKPASFSGLMTSPLTRFSSLTSFIPLPWSPRSNTTESFVESKAEVASPSSCSGEKDICFKRSDSWRS
ncbi:uncharacterized protein EV420DRAFT_1758126 [Desarmillaria tabescens]|uniref:Uncharacterized protein n=1 Tax=Armillaria tabescens TaxID=1929756 RepID=A0AA39U6E6_ARMTA|nr:uncharacterized protein EV420DRAFT_1758126 [Desarmillaria tabescens]KAK0467895.1 hypothetical protein EV420DRAFT_1758126 [Desarmillaria tabescens]